MLLLPIVTSSETFTPIDKQTRRLGFDQVRFLGVLPSNVALSVSVMSDLRTSTRWLPGVVSVLTYSA